MEEILNKLKEKHKTQTDCQDEELYEILKEIGAKEIVSGLDVDKHRWYERTTTVYELEVNGEIKYLGVNCATDLFSEGSSFEDLCEEYCFFEMEKVMIPSYKEIKLAVN